MSAGSNHLSNMFKDLLEIAGPNAVTQLHYPEVMDGYLHSDTWQESRCKLGYKRSKHIALDRASLLTSGKGRSVIRKLSMTPSNPLI